MGFLVNDYGKDGPARDAQDLLDKHVAEWAAQNGIKKYTVGKKDVSCELYLNLILFDEHTCTASANVCWDEPGAGGADKTATDKDGDGAKKAVEKKSSEKKPDDAKAAAQPAPAENAAEKPAYTSPEAAAPIETGTLPGAGDAPAKPAADVDAAERAAAAAERAAEAAERAAAAAERAAQAAKPNEATPPSQLEMPGFGAGPKPAEVPPVTPTEPKT
jgi:hypothetical protein